MFSFKPHTLFHMQENCFGTLSKTEVQFGFK